MDTDTKARVHVEFTIEDYEIVCQVLNDRFSREAVTAWGRDGETGHEQATAEIMRDRILAILGALGKHP